MAATKHVRSVSILAPSLPPPSSGNHRQVASVGQAVAVCERPRDARCDHRGHPSELTPHCKRPQDALSSIIVDDGYSFKVSDRRVGRIRPQKSADRIGSDTGRVDVTSSASIFTCSARSATNAARGLGGFAIARRESSPTAEALTLATIRYISRRLVTRSARLRFPAPPPRDRGSSTVPLVLGSCCPPVVQPGVCPTMHPSMMRDPDSISRLLVRSERRPRRRGRRARVPRVTPLRIERLRGSARQLVRIGARRIAEPDLCTEEEAVGEEVRRARTEPDARREVRGAVLAVVADESSRTETMKPAVASR